MARVDEIKVIEKLKKLILDQVQALYGPKYASACTFSVITSRFHSGGTLNEIEYNAQAIVYIHPGSHAEWKLLVEGDTGSSTQQAVELLYRKVQGQVDQVTNKMGEGWIYNGVKVRNPDA
ncbi:hypothetical protein P153DRAFT_429665 [Dothidotthia symphoricarpi CBS 119687]|uniref:Uncharacterized protein n=1 Tax=Dothidotthia symphoricarpi CBS 119687 TaxID=1392245 RepID=A0A6A6AKA2_9PLEO|nr:uncharacterized protein P153DRAFT_429665 [Dothidotthia symphoricarpi CBS 119687]KAF2131344.1 hypothetical protein P153DRAFT_429665 [Dothidotthia symphoricarpi CBS 119687]